MDLKKQLPPTFGKTCVGSRLTARGYPWRRSMAASSLSLVWTKGSNGNESGCGGWRWMSLYLVAKALQGAVDLHRTPSESTQQSHFPSHHLNVVEDTRAQQQRPCLRRWPRRIPIIERPRRADSYELTLLPNPPSV